MQTPRLSHALFSSWTNDWENAPSIDRKWSYVTYRRHTLRYALALSMTQLIDQRSLMFYPEQVQVPVQCTVFGAEAAFFSMVNVQAYRFHRNMNLFDARLLSQCNTYKAPLLVQFYLCSVLGPVFPRAKKLNRWIIKVLGLGKTRSYISRSSFS